MFYPIFLYNSSMLLRLHTTSLSFKLTLPGPFSGSTHIGSLKRPLQLRISWLSLKQIQFATKSIRKMKPPCHKSFLSALLDSGSLALFLPEYKCHLAHSIRVTSLCYNSSDSKIQHSYYLAPEVIPTQLINWLQWRCFRTYFRLFFSMHTKL